MPASAPQTFYRYFPVAQRDRDWGLFLTSVGASHLLAGCSYTPSGHPKGYNFRPPQGRVLDEYQLIYISAGSGWFRSGKSRRTKIEGGSVMLLFPGVWHSYAPSPDRGLD